MTVEDNKHLYNHANVTGALISIRGTLTYIAALVAESQTLSFNPSIGYSASVISKYNFTLFHDERV